MDNEFSVDIGEIKRVIGTADVLLIRFPHIDKRLLIDARYDDQEGPLVRVVPRVGSAAERFRHLKEIRPRFPVPQNIVSFTWPKHVGSMEEFGIWQAILDRCARTGYSEWEKDCQGSYRELAMAERREMISAITGEGYETIWQRKN